MPTDTERLDKLQRIERLVRHRPWFIVSDGAVCSCKTNSRKDGSKYLKSLRRAIDAAPYPKEPA
jgi:hypothetical protein